jgi:hypothetical protein
MLCCTIAQMSSPFTLPSCIFSGHGSNKEVVAVHFHHHFAEHAFPGRRPHSFAEDPFEPGKERFILPSHTVVGYPRQVSDILPIFSDAPGRDRLRRRRPGSAALPCDRTAGKLLNIRRWLFRQVKEKRVSSSMQPVVSRDCEQMFCKVHCIVERERSLARDLADTLRH